MVPFSVDVERNGVVHLVGELDLAGLRSLRAALARVDGAVVFDCSDLTFVDLSGLGVLIETIDRCQARGARCAIRHRSRCLTWLLELLGLEALFADGPSCEATPSLVSTGPVRL